jgi:hypothetical protein
MRALKRSAWGAAAAALIGGFGLAASPAAADELLGATPEVEGSHAATCAARLSDDPASWQAELTAPASGFLRGTLSGGSGDWDLAIFSARSGEPVAAGASSSADEIASGYALEGERLIAQACRLSGEGEAPRLTVGVEAVEAEPTPAPALLRVAIDDEADMAALEASGIDVTHSVGDDFADVVAYGREDRERLTRAGLAYSTRVGNLIRQGVRQRAAEQRPAARDQGVPGAARAGRRGGRASQRSDGDLSPHVRLRSGAEAPGQTLPADGQADHPSRADLRGKAGAGHRDQPQRQALGG